MSLHFDKIELIRNTEIFSELREYEIDIIAKFSEFKSIKKGEPIFNQGEPADCLYIISKGLVGIISLQNDYDISIARMVAGETLGELDFLGGTKRSAGAFTEEDSVLLEFPSPPYTPLGISQEHPYISARILYRLAAIISGRIWHVSSMLGEKTKWLEDLHKQLQSDKMTGLFSASYLSEDFLNLLPDIGSRAALLMIKPDNFKYINDRFGHDAGDQVLNMMSTFLQSELKENDVGIRYRGDEYAAILLNADKNEAVRRAQEIARSYRGIDLAEILGVEGIKITVSIGIALYPDNTIRSRALVDLAHRRLYRARDLGGNRIVA